MVFDCIKGSDSKIVSHQIKVLVIPIRSMSKVRIMLRYGII